MNLIDKLTGKSKRAKAARVSAANAQIEETRNKVGFFGAIFAIIAVLFMTQTVQANVVPASEVIEVQSYTAKSAADEINLVGRYGTKDMGGFFMSASAEGNTLIIDYRFLGLDAALADNGLARQVLEDKMVPTLKRSMGPYLSIYKINLIVNIKNSSGVNVVSTAILYTEL